MHAGTADQHQRAYRNHLDPNLIRGKWWECFSLDGGMDGEHMTDLWALNVPLAAPKLKIQIMNLCQKQLYWVYWGGWGGVKV